MADARDHFEPHDLGCTCWPHISQRDAIAAVEAAALAEYRDGKRHLAQPEAGSGIDVALLADVLAGVDVDPYTVAAEYARLRGGDRG